jgi:hypothetical protein
MGGRPNDIAEKRSFHFPSVEAFLAWLVIRVKKEMALYTFTELPYVPRAVWAKLTFLHT